MKIKHKFLHYLVGYVWYNVSLFYLKPNFTGKLHANALVDIIVLIRIMNWFPNGHYMATPLPGPD